MAGDTLAFSDQFFTQLQIGVFENGRLRMEAGQAEHSVQSCHCEELSFHLVLQ
jgi:hypothetical protein